MTSSRSHAPYPNAHWYVVTLVVITVIGFWRGYFAVLGAAVWSWHFHGITASLWIALCGLQSWSIATRRVALHRAFGKASLFLFPFFFASMVTIWHTMAAATSPSHPFYRFWGGPLGVTDGVATAAIGWLFVEGLRHRRQPQQHARFMLAIPLFLLPPALERVFSHYVPGLTMDGPQDFHFFRWDEHLSIAICIAVTLLLYRQAPRHGQAFLVAAGLMIAQGLGFETIGRSTAWLAIFVAFGSVPAPIVVLIGLAIGTAITWLGWTVPSRPAPSRPIATNV